MSDLHVRVRGGRGAAAAGLRPGVAGGASDGRGVRRGRGRRLLRTRRPPGLHVSEL